MKKLLFRLLRRAILFRRRFTTRREPKKIQKILVVRSDALGDLALSLEGIYSLQQHFPEADIYVIANVSYHPLFNCIDSLAGLIDIVPSSASWWNRVKHVFALWRHHFDLSVDICHGDTLYYALLTFMARIPWRIGYDIGIHGFLYHTSMKLETIEIYEKDIPKKILKETLGVRSLNYVPLSLDIDLEKDFLQSLQRKYGVRPNDLVIGLNLDTSKLNPIRAWDIHKFGTLIQEIYKEYDCKILITGLPETLVLWDQIKDYVSRDVLSLIGKTNVEELMYLLKRCDVFVSNNTGSMHLSVVLETPTVVINGPSSIVRWGPRDSKHRIVSKGLECSYYDCDGKTCETQYSCIRDITVDEVLEAFRSVMNIRKKVVEY
jgi:ADP-heptose:LPS heptosyltransferase